MGSYSRRLLTETAKRVAFYFSVPLLLQVGCGQNLDPPFGPPFWTPLVESLLDAIWPSSSGPPSVPLNSFLGRFPPKVLHFLRLKHQKHFLHLAASNAPRMCWSAETPRWRKTKWRGSMQIENLQVFRKLSE